MTTMGTTPPEPILGKGATPAGLFSRFWGFDNLIGSVLVKLMYYLGLACIGLVVVAGLFSALATLTQSFITGLGMLLGTSIGGVLAVVVWRFSCEIAILVFQIYNRLGEIRDRLPLR